MSGDVFSMQILRKLNIPILENGFANQIRGMTRNIVSIPVFQLNKTKCKITPDLPGVQPYSSIRKPMSLIHLSGLTMTFDVITGSGTSLCCAL